MTMSHVHSGLLRARAKLLGEALALERDAKAVRADLAHIDRALALTGYEGDPRAVAPIGRRPRQLFAHKQLSRLVYEAIRMGASDNEAITGHVINAMGWDAGDTALWRDIKRRVKDVTKRL